MNQNNHATPHVTEIPESPSPSPPAMKLFFIHASDDNGDSNDLFISAPNMVLARLLFSNHCLVGEWRPAGKVVMFEVSMPNTQCVLEWHEDVRQVHEW